MIGLVGELVGQLPGSSILLTSVHFLFPYPFHMSNQFCLVVTFLLTFFFLFSAFILALVDSKGVSIYSRHIFPLAADTFVIVTCMCFPTPYLSRCTAVLYSSSSSIALTCQKNSSFVLYRYDTIDSQINITTTFQNKSFSLTFSSSRPWNRPHTRNNNDR